MTLEVVSDNVELLEHVIVDDKETSDFADRKLLRTGRPVLPNPQIPSFTVAKHNETIDANISVLYLCKF
jgi:ATP-dependent phosphoenolpyruvate carboxykinase